MPKKTIIRKTSPAQQGRYVLPSCYAQLTIDEAFKKTFASEGCEEMLATMLNVFLGKKLAFPIKSVAIKNPYIPGETLKNRNAVLDIRCEDTKGNKFIVEMQVNSQEHFLKRAIFYMSMSIAKSGKKGKNWDFDFPNTYSLNFLDFEPNFGKKCNDIVQYISLHNDEHPEIRYNEMGFVFVLLPRFKKTVEECQSFHDQLLFSLRYAHTLDKKPRHFKGKFFDMLFALAKISNFNDMEYSAYMARMMGNADRRAQLAFAEKKGKEESLIGVAKSMLKEKFDLATIVRITKLPKEEIMALR